MLRWLLLLLTLGMAFLAVLFAIANQGEVAVTIPGTIFIPPLQTHVPIFSLVFAPMLIGFLAGLLVNWINSIPYRQESLRLLRLNRALEEELCNLRNLPLGDDTHN